MSKLSNKQSHLLELLQKRKDEPFRYNRGVELFTGCGFWRTAYSLQEKGFVEILRNENDQLMVYLSDN